MNTTIEYLCQIIENQNAIIEKRNKTISKMNVIRKNKNEKKTA